MWAAVAVPDAVRNGACGALSGFHSLVGSGTTSKQVDNEADLRLAGWSMLIEVFWQQ